MHGLGRPMKSTLTPTVLIRNCTANRTHFEVGLSRVCSRYQTKTTLVKSLCLQPRVFHLLHINEFIRILFINHGHLHCITFVGNQIDGIFCGWSPYLCNMRCVRLLAWCAPGCPHLRCEKRTCGQGESTVEGTTCFPVDSRSLTLYVVQCSADLHAFSLLLAVLVG